MATKYYIGTADGDYDNAANWDPSKPVASDDVKVLPGGNPIDTNLSAFSAVEFASFVVEPGVAYQIANGLNDMLVVNCAGAVEWSSSGVGYLDLGASAVSPVIKETGSDAASLGLYLSGTAVALLQVLSGGVKCVGLTLADLEQFAGTLICDPDCTLTDTGAAVLSVLSGSALFESAVDTVHCSGGTVTLRGSGAVNTLLLCDAGSIVSNTTGTVAKARADSDGVIDFIQSNRARTVTTLERSGSGQILLDPDVVTVTNAIVSEGPMQIGSAGR